MTTTFDLLYDTTTLSLNAGANYLVEYNPRSLNMTDEAAVAAVYLGSKNVLLEPTITESAKVMITGTLAAMQTTFRTIENVLKVIAPRRRASQSGPQVYLKWQADGAVTLLRSEIIRGSVEWADDQALRWGFLENGEAEIIIAFTRRFFFEYNTEVQLTPTNDNESDYLAGLDIFNCNDGSGSAPSKRENWAQFDAAEILGSLPAPVRLDIRNTYATALRRVYIAHKAQGTPASFTHILEAEAATLGAAGATTADAACSGGSKVTVTNVPATAQNVFTWTISSTQASYVLSQWIRPLLRFPARPNNSTCSAKLILKDSTTGAVIQQTVYQLLNTTDFIQALPTLELSPNLQGQLLAGAMKLVLQLKDPSATCDFTLDFIMLAPIEMANGFRLLKPIDETLVTIATPLTITDNMPDESVFVESRQGIIQGFGGPIMFVPGMLQWLEFLMDGSGDADVARSIALKAFMRPRVHIV